MGRSPASVHPAHARAGLNWLTMSTPLESPDQGGLATLDRELEELIREENIEPGDHERFSHYVKKEKILESAITGKPVRALCGKKWTPGRDPEKFPICPTCKEIYESLVG
jgi:hypothetical protein